MGPRHRRCDRHNLLRLFDDQMGSRCHVQLTPGPDWLFRANGKLGLVCHWFHSLGRNFYVGSRRYRSGDNIWVLNLAEGAITDRTAIGLASIGRSILSNAQNERKPKSSGASERQLLGVKYPDG